MSLPDLSPDDRELILLGVGAGFDDELVLQLITVEAETLQAWLAQGAADTQAGKGTDAASFAAAYETAAEEAIETSMLAARVLRNQIRTQPAAARAHLRELGVQRDLERARELTTR